MRHLVMMVAAVGAAAGCKARAATVAVTPATPAAPVTKPASVADQVPAVADAAVLLPPAVAMPPVLVVIPAEGGVALASPPDGDGWAALSVATPSHKQPVALYHLGPISTELAEVRGQVEAALPWAAPVPVIAPPPREPTAPPAGVDVTDERPEGQYKLRRPGDGPPSSAHARALARARGVVRDRNKPPPETGFGRSSGTIGADPTPPPALPTRLISAVGSVHDDDRPLAADTLVVAAPTARATAVVEVLGLVRSALIAVNHGGALRALRVGFGVERGGPAVLEPTPHWAEVRVATDGLAIEAVPGPARTLARTAGRHDGAALTAANADERAAAGGDAADDVDVLVADDVDVQRLVDVLAALDAAGARVISLGRAPAADTDEASLRGQRLVIAHPGPITAPGIDKALIRQAVRERLPAIKACYEQALAADPALGGVVEARFEITPGGALAKVQTAGVTPALAACVADVLRPIKIPREKRAAPIEVVYPFNFRT